MPPRAIEEGTSLLQGRSDSWEVERRREGSIELTWGVGGEGSTQKVPEV